MDVILPVAGLGSRLRPLTWSRPKPLVSVGGKPILAHVIDRVLPVEPDRLIFITGFLGNQIEEWAEREYDIPLSFVEQPEMRGQTDAIVRTRALCQGSGLILFPDMVFEADFSELETVDADVVIYTKYVEDPSRFGVTVEENGRVTRLVEKPTVPISNEAVVGIYYFRKMADLYDAIDEQMERGMTMKNEYFIADAIQIMIDRGHKVITTPVSVWEDCGNIEVLLSTNRYLLDLVEPATPREEALIVHPSVVADDAVIEGSVIGPYASIGAGAVVRDSIVRNAIIDDGATIERAVIENSVVGQGSTVEGRASVVYIGDNAVTHL
ncbi:MAG: sugar phosphate nucleotidyltransferase [Thermomicrobiales bacterium]